MKENNKENEILEKNSGKNLSKENLKEKNNTPTLKQVLTVIIILFVCSAGFITLSALDDASVNKSTPGVIVIDTDVKYYIDYEFENNYVFFRDCYAGISGMQINTWDVRVVLQDTATGESVTIPTYMVMSEEAAAHFDADNENYQRTGFSANVSMERIDLDNKSYKILIYYNNNDADIYVDTGEILTAKGTTK